MLVIPGKIRESGFAVRPVVEGCVEAFAEGNGFVDPGFQAVLFPDGLARAGVDGGEGGKLGVTQLFVFDDAAVPDGVEVLAVAEEEDCYFIAALVTVLTDVHRLVHIADEVDEEGEGRCVEGTGEEFGGVFLGQVGQLLAGGGVSFQYFGHQFDAFADVVDLFVGAVLFVQLADRHLGLDGHVVPGAGEIPTFFRLDVIGPGADLGEVVVAQCRIDAGAGGGVQVVVANFTDDAVAVGAPGEEELGEEEEEDGEEAV